MSEAHGTGHAHHEPSFFFKYVWATDHKMIGKQFLFTSLLFLFLAGALAMSLRWQLAYPQKPVPIVGKWLFATAEERQKADAEIAGAKAENRVPNPAVANVGYVKPETFTMLTTMHGTLMIFFVVIPILVGAFGNFLIPLHVGAPDMAFPNLNALSYWVFWLACVFAIMSFLGEGGAASAGWTSYAPLSAIPIASPGLASGQTCWLLALVCVGFSSIFGAVNYLTTILTMRAPGLSMFRLPLTTWSQFITAVLQLIATPVLAAALLMLTCDRLLGSSFFLPGGLEVSSKAIEHSGGSVLLWQHVFWFYSHPAVYILVLPGMGIASDLLAVGARKAIFGYRAMVYSITAIAGLGFIVWAHHMFVSGMNPTLATTFMISTMMIALPSSVKVFNWLGTMWRGSIRFDTPTLNAISFVALFTIGGLSGIFMAATPVDIFIHDTYFIVAHFHYVVFGGTLFAVFGGIFFWFPKMFGRMMNPALGILHWALTFIFFNATFFPMHIIGAGGHMRRISSTEYYPFLEPLAGWNRMITISAICLGFSQLVFLGNFLWSLRHGKKADNNPWQANTLEWTIASPPGHGNYDPVPTVHRGPYEYGAESGEKDWSSQVDGGGAAPAH